jgi:hypothetical protein
MPQSRIYNPFVGSGGGGGGVTPAQVAAAEEIQTQEFTFTSGSFTMFTIPANSKIVSVAIEVQTAFDDPAATIIVGDSGTADRLMSAAKNDLEESGVYQTFPIYEYPTATPILIVVSPGASTVGAGYVTITHNSNN